MKNRHRIPSIFNLSMVDVLCCALGCVILLWLLFFREAKEHSEAAGQLGKQLTSSQLELTSLQQSMAATVKQQRITQEALKQAQVERDLLQQLAKMSAKDLEMARLALKVNEADLAKHQSNLRDLQGRELALKGDLDRKAKEAVELAAKRELAMQKVSALEKDIQDRQGLILAAAKQAADLTGRLKTAEGQIKQFEKDARALNQERQDQTAKLDTAGRRVTDLEKQITKGNLALGAANEKTDKLLQHAKGLEAQLAAANAKLKSSDTTVTDLKGQTQALAAKVTAAENRFAGIELTGERVLFIVDWSGSMGMKNSKEDDATKWPLACDTIGKLLGSLPGLKKYQVLLFSSSFHYPLGGEKKWLDFDGKASVDHAVAKLKSKPPQGGTNMADVMKEAFDVYRKEGLDTIYVFSDGLPNVGPGLPANFKTLSEEEKNAKCCAWLRNELFNWNAPGPDKRRVRINTIGFFYDTPAVGAFLWALAREHDGSFVGMSKP